MTFVENAKPFIDSILSDVIPPFVVKQKDFPGYMFCYKYGIAFIWYALKDDEYFLGSDGKRIQYHSFIFKPPYETTPAEEQEMARFGSTDQDPQSTPDGLNATKYYADQGPIPGILDWIMIGLFGRVARTAVETGKTAATSEELAATATRTVEAQSTAVRNATNVENLVQADSKVGETMARFLQKVVNENLPLQLEKIEAELGRVNPRITEELLDDAYRTDFLRGFADPQSSTRRLFDYCKVLARYPGKRNPLAWAGKQEFQLTSEQLQMKKAWQTPMSTQWYTEFVDFAKSDSKFFRMLRTNSYYEKASQKLEQEMEVLSDQYKWNKGISQYYTADELRRLSSNASRSKEIYSYSLNTSEYGAPARRSSGFRNNNNNYYTETSTRFNISKTGQYDELTKRTVFQTKLDDAKEILGKTTPTPTPSPDASPVTQAASKAADTFFNFLRDVFKTTDNVSIPTAGANAAGSRVANNGRPSAFSTVLEQTAYLLTGSNMHEQVEGYYTHLEYGTRSSKVHYDLNTFNEFKKMIEQLHQEDERDTTPDPAEVLTALIDTVAIALPQATNQEVVPEDLKAYLAYYSQTLKTAVRKIESLPIYYQYPTGLYWELKITTLNYPRKEEAFDLILRTLGIQELTTPSLLIPDLTLTRHFHKTDSAPSDTSSGYQMVSRNLMQTEDEIETVEDLGKTKYNGDHRYAEFELAVDIFLTDVKDQVRNGEIKEEYKNVPTPFNMPQLYTMFEPFLPQAWYLFVKTNDIQRSFPTLCGPPPNSYQLQQTQWHNMPTNTPAQNSNIRMDNQVYLIPAIASWLEERKKLQDRPQNFMSNASTILELIPQYGQKLYEYSADMDTVLKEGQKDLTAYFNFFNITLAIIDRYSVMFKRDLQLVLKQNFTSTTADKIYTAVTNISTRTTIPKEQIDALSYNFSQQSVEQLSIFQADTSHPHNLAEGITLETAQIVLQVLETQEIKDSIQYINENRTPLQAILKHNPYAVSIQLGLKKAAELNQVLNPQIFTPETDQTPVVPYQPMDVPIDITPAPNTLPGNSTTPTNVTTTTYQNNIPTTFVHPEAGNHHAQETAAEREAEHRYLREHNLAEATNYTTAHEQYVNGTLPVEVTPTDTNNGNKNSWNFWSWFWGVETKDEHQNAIEQGTPLITLNYNNQTYKLSWHTFYQHMMPWLMFFGAYLAIVGVGSPFTYMVTETSFIPEQPDTPRPPKKRSYTTGITQRRRKVNHNYISTLTFLKNLYLTSVETLTINGTKISCEPHSGRDPLRLN